MKDWEKKSCRDVAAGLFVEMRYLHSISFDLQYYSDL